MKETEDELKETKNKYEADSKSKISEIEKLKAKNEELKSKLALQEVIKSKIKQESDRKILELEKEKEQIEKEYGQKMLRLNNDICQLRLDAKEQETEAERLKKKIAEGERDKALLEAQNANLRYENACILHKQESETQLKEAEALRTKEREEAEALRTKEREEHAKQMSESEAEIANLVRLVSQSSLRSTGTCSEASIP